MVITPPPAQMAMGQTPVSLVNMAEMNKSSVLGYSIYSFVSFWWHLVLVHTRMLHHYWQWLISIMNHDYDEQLSTTNHYKPLILGPISIFTMNISHHQFPIIMNIHSPPLTNNSQHISLPIHCSGHSFGSGWRGPCMALGFARRLSSCGAEDGVAQSVVRVVVWNGCCLVDKPLVVSHVLNYWGYLVAVNLTSS